MTPTLSIITPVITEMVVNITRANHTITTTITTNVKITTRQPTTSFHITNQLALNRWSSRTLTKTITINFYNVVSKYTNLLVKLDATFKS